jgi:hypothetical protein
MRDIIYYYLHLNTRKLIFFFTHLYNYREYIKIPQFFRLYS